jgi:DNA-binding MurR/RpiR family transcriptional regulator
MTTAGPAPTASLTERIRAHWDELAPAERQFASFLLEAAPERIAFATAGSLGDLAGCSDATVVRTAKRLGYSGLPDLKREVGVAMARSVAPDVRLHQRITEVGDQPDQIVGRIHDEIVERLEATRAGFDSTEFTRASGLIAAAQIVHTFGAGASELAARHLALKLNRIGHRARHIGQTGFQLADELLTLASGDAVVLFAPLRLLVDAEVLLSRAASVGASRILVADAPLRARLAGQVDAALHAPHTPTGITAEGLPAVMLADALVMAVAATDESRALETSDVLTHLRQQLLVTKRRADPPPTNHGAGGSGASRLR